MSENVKMAALPGVSLEIDAFLRCIAERDYSVLCSGAASGLIGEVVKCAKKYKCEVNGAVVDCEMWTYDNLTSVTCFASYTERQTYMFSTADRIVFLPGGLGTLHEICYLLIEKKMNPPGCKVFFLDCWDFWAPFFDLLKSAVNIGFIAEKDARYTVINSKLGFDAIFAQEQAGEQS
ncbi:MAG: LOG family protein [Holosporales bacterium]|jgi:predicted Rossmann-fold nucleotide-binding protein|nr:LOG family protein [Holosporales bacterium]